MQSIRGHSASKALVTEMTAKSHTIQACTYTRLARGNKTQPCCKRMVKLNKVTMYNKSQAHNPSEQSG